MSRRPSLLVALLIAAACAAPAEPTPGAPTPTGSPRTSPSPGVTAGRATPSAPPATQAPSPTLSATPAASATAAASVTAAPVASPFDPARIALELQPFTPGGLLADPTYLTHAGDGSGLLYAVEQRGTIVVLEQDGSVRDARFLEIRQRVGSGGERGLLGLAFHPEYAENGRFFVDYTDTAGDTVVAEFARSGDALADPGSERVLLRVGQPFAKHNGGMIGFGPDGYMYIALGDGGSAGDPRGHGQNRATLLGAILRIDVDVDVDVDGAEPYAIPADNPFSADPNARPEIWAFGLRNPWRFSFDRQSGALFIGDVGQGGWEEIDVNPAGQGGLNFGWNIMEGPRCVGSQNCDLTGLTLPVAAYNHDQGGCSVTGGYVYRGEQFPGLAGAYLFADYCNGIIWGLDAAAALAGGSAQAHELESSGVNPSSFGEDEAGELYLVAHGGSILRIAAIDR